MKQKRKTIQADRLGEAAEASETFLLHKWENRGWESDALKDLFNPCVKVRSRGSRDMEASFWVHMKQFCPGAQSGDCLWLSTLLYVVQPCAGPQVHGTQLHTVGLGFSAGRRTREAAPSVCRVPRGNCSPQWPLDSYLSFKGPCPVCFSLTFRALRNPCLPGVFTYLFVSVTWVWVSGIHSTIICANGSLLAECWGEKSAFHPSMCCLPKRLLVNISKTLSKQTNK